jgi:hypothetical protein
MTAFASIGPDCTLPVTNLPRAPLNPGWTLNGPVTWNAYITYTDHGRNDRSQTFSGSSSVWSPVPIDFQGVVQGGDIHLSLSSPVKDQDGADQVLTWTGDSTITGINPPASAIKQRLGALPYQVIAFKESGFRQFDDSTGLPLFGPPNGFGVMQLDNSPAPTAQQIWNWQQNVDAGRAKFDAGSQVIAQHYANLIQAHPTLPALSQADLRPACYQYYNSGNSSFYWLPNSTNTGWTINSAATYGAVALAIEQAVSSNNPPNGW